MYNRMVENRCNLEREVIKNSLSIAVISPDEFAYSLIKGPGYMSVVAGEVVHVVKCLPVEVTIDHGENCYNQLQVSRNNETWYMSPRTHILLKRGTQIPCSHLLPSYYKINEVWYKIMPRPLEAIAPSIIQSQMVNDWEDKSPASLATSGIYTEKDLKKLRERINFPMERPALLNVLARGMSGIPLSETDDSIINLFDE